MEYNFLFPILIVFLPFLFLVIYSLLPGKIKRLPNTNTIWTGILMIILIYAIAEYPWELSFDKIRYIRQYFRVLHSEGEYEFRDLGWITYSYILSKIFGLHVELFFWTTAFVYVGAFYFLAIKLFEKNKAGYFFVMCTGCLGFSSYGTNVIRSGFALALLLVCLTLPKKRWLQLVFAIIALSIHRSMMIPIVAFIASKTIKKTEIALAIWGLCLIFSAIKFDMGPLFESLGFIDERIDFYTESLGNEGGRYKQGFRLDFLTYSIVPILISWYYLLKKEMSDMFYILLVRTYLLANAVWLLAIRIQFSDRLAYLSWCLIPFLTLYPVLKYPYKFRYPHKIMLAVMYIFMGVNLYLFLKSMV